MDNVNAITTPLSKAQQALQIATTPEQTKQVEAMAAAARAWAKENNDYESVVGAGEVYIKARRKTTELIQPTIRLGGDGSNQYISKGNNDVTLADYGFTKMQWQRRKKELEISDDEIDEYIMDCIEKRVEPTTTGLVRYHTSPHVSYNSGDNEWYTPAEYIEAARAVMGEIDLDPASSEIANKTVGATIYFTAEDDGLRYSWNGRVWMNPPYASELIGKFTEKLYNHFIDGDVTEAIVLVNNATETGWFQVLLECASAVCFVKRRIKFVDMAGNPSGAPLQGQAILYLGEKPDLFAEHFGLFGAVLYGRS